MKKFMVIYHAPEEASKGMGEMTKEEQAKGMEAWMTWAQACGDKLVDLGAPLMYGMALSPDGSRQKSEKDVAGYSILRAENMDEAIQLLQGHPHLAWNALCSIEVHEVMPIPGS